MLSQDDLNRLYRYAMSLTNQRDDAYDLLQSSLEKYIACDQSKVNKPSAYLRQMMRNQFIDQVRRQAKITFELIEDQDALEYDTQSLETFVINDDLVAIIWDMLEANEREILYLWSIEGFTAAEIANEIDAPRGTVLSRIHRIRKKVLHMTVRDDAFHGLAEEYQA